MARAEANRHRSILDLLKSRRDRSRYKASIPSKRPRYLDASASHSAPGQGTPIAETVEDAAEDRGPEDGEIEEKEEYEEDDDSENMSDYFAEADSVFEVDPESEDTWRATLSHYLSRDFGNNPKPSLPRTDGEFRHRYNELLIGIFKWACKYFSSYKERYDLADFWQYEELTRYIDSIAVAMGPKLLWEDVVQTLTPRLVMGLIMKVIQIHIFGLELFGVSEAKLLILRSADSLRTEPDHESPLPTIFKRQEIRASIINSFCPSPSDLPSRLQPDILKVMTGIVSLLKPFATDPACQTSRYAHSLAFLLVDAARLHIDMRREPDTIYFVYSLTPGDRIDDHTQCEVPLLPTYTKPERGNPEQRIHIVIAPGIMALRNFSSSYRPQYQTRSVADAMAVAEWVNPDRKRRAPKKLSEYLDYYVDKEAMRGQPRRGPSSDELSQSSDDGHDQFKFL